jgi:hypothetical protein
MKEPPPEVPCGKHSSFTIRSPEPFNGGPPLDLLSQSELTWCKAMPSPIARSLSSASRCLLNNDIVIFTQLNETIVSCG